MTQFITLPKNSKDITGQRFGKLVALGPVGRANKLVVWHCQCDCGNTVSVRSNALRSGSTLSCSCLQKELSARSKTTHGMHKDPIYTTWANMIKRCTNPTRRDYASYGGRGIEVCQEWRGSFQAFYDCVSVLPDFGTPGYTLDRINVDGNYEVGNVRWLSKKDQRRNTRQNRMITHNGKTQCFAAWAEEYGIRFDTLSSRLKTGWDFERALITPVRQRRK